MSNIPYDDDDDSFYDHIDYAPKAVPVKNRVKVLYLSNNIIHYYPSKMTPGANIYDAITGKLVHNVFVGKDNMFKVLVLGQHLYYKSPEEYSFHFNTSVDRSVISNWYKKNRKEL